MTRGSSPQSGELPLPQREDAVLLRAATPDDDLDALHDGDPMWPGHEAYWRTRASLPDDVTKLTVVAELDGVPAAHGHVIAAPAGFEGHGFSYLFVPPEHRGRGVGRAMLSLFARQAGASALPGVVGRAAAEDPGVLAALERIGCREVGRAQESVLDLTALDRAALGVHVERAETSGFRCAPLPDDASPEDWATAHGIFVTAGRDAPDNQGADRGIPLDLLRSMVEEPANLVLAWQGDRPVGLTSVTRRPTAGEVNTVLTAVLPDARGQGVATALKAAHALMLADRGYTRLVTQNMEQNAPILAANATLGFTPGRTWITLVLPALPA